MKRTFPLNVISKEVQATGKRRRHQSAEFYFSKIGQNAIRTPQNVLGISETINLSFSRKYDSYLNPKAWNRYQKAQIFKKELDTV